MNIIFYILFFGLISCNNSEKEIYLIPENFQGKICIAFDQKNGEKALYENGNRIYKIPADGILITQFSSQKGYIDAEYYFLDQKNTRIFIPIASRTNELEINEIGIYRSSTGVFGDSSDKNSVRYIDFYVVNKKDLSSYFTDKNLNDFHNRVLEKVIQLKNE